MSGASFCAARSACSASSIKTPSKPIDLLSSERSADTDVFINWFLRITITRYCFIYRFYNIEGIKRTDRHFGLFYYAVINNLRASPFCRIARHVRRTVELCGAAFCGRTSELLCRVSIQNPMSWKLNSYLSRCK